MFSAIGPACNDKVPALWTVGLIGMLAAELSRGSGRRRHRRRSPCSFREGGR